jgi:hypothetical protein
LQKAKIKTLGLLTFDVEKPESFSEKKYYKVVMGSPVLLTYLGSKLLAGKRKKRLNKQKQNLQKTPDFCNVPTVNRLITESRCSWRRVL